MPFVTDRLAEQARVPGRPVEPGQLADQLAAHIIGQDPAIEALARAVTLARAGLGDGQRPLASVLLVGPTGVGKTELVRQLAAALRSGPDDLCRVDMSALAQEHYAASFSGAPPGYAGSKEGFSLFERSKIEGDPYTPGIVLFDEVEKAHTTVLRSLLHVLDHGVLRLANGQSRVDFRNCFIFLTSNLGSGELARIFNGPLGQVERWRSEYVPGLPGMSTLLRGSSSRVTQRALRRFFDPEFLNRLDEIVVMHDLDAAATRRIVHLQVEELRRQAARKYVELTVAPQVLDLLHQEGFAPAYGARSLRRAVRRHLALPVAHALVEAQPSGSAPVRLHAEVISGAVCVVGP